MSDVQTDAGTAPAKPILDIGAMLTGTFRLYFRRFFYFFGVTLLGLIVIYALAFAVFLPVMLQGGDLETPDPEAAFATVFAIMAPFMIVFALGFIYLNAVIIRSAVTVKLHDRVEFATALGAAFKGLIPLALIGLLMLIPIYLGFLLLVIPGLYLVSLLYVLTPAVVFERRGFGGLARSVQLTSGYRWAIMGFFVILAILTFLISLASTLVFGGIGAGLMFAASSAGDETLGFVLYMITSVLNLFASAATMPLSFIAVAAVYVRLREIKEGGGHELLEVFE